MRFKALPSHRIAQTAPSTTSDSFLGASGIGLAVDALGHGGRGVKTGGQGRVRSCLLAGKPSLPRANCCCRFCCCCLLLQLLLQLWWFSSSSSASCLLPLVLLAVVGHDLVVRHAVEVVVVVIPGVSSFVGWCWWCWRCSVS